MANMIVINNDRAGFEHEIYWVNRDKLVGWYPDDVHSPNPSAWAFYVKVEGFAAMKVSWSSLIKLMNQIDGSDGVAQLFIWANRHVQREQKLSNNSWDDAILRTIEEKWHHFPFVNLHHAVLSGQIIIDKIITLTKNVKKVWGADEMEQISHDRDRKNKALRTMLALLDEYLKSGELLVVPVTNVL